MKFGDFIKREKKDDDPTTGSPSAELPGTPKSGGRAETVWYACIFCSKKFYTELPSLHAHIKRTHYHRALQILNFAGKDVKERLLDFWRRKNQNIDPAQISQVSMS
jgi:hypothetical protein